MLNLALYLIHRSIFVELGCPTRAPDEWVSATQWIWPSADTANAAIQDELDTWAPGLGMQTLQWTTGRAA